MQIVSKKIKKMVCGSQSYQCAIWISTGETLDHLDQEGPIMTEIVTQNMRSAVSII